MKVAIAFAFVVLGLFSSSTFAACDHSWQSASDGSNCGGRAADRRPGGR